MKNKVKRKKGASLIEVIVSITILAIVIIPISNIVINAATTSKMSERKQIASFKGQKLLEEFKSYNKITVDLNGKFKLQNGKFMDTKGVDSYEQIDSFLSGGQNYESKVTMTKDSQFRNVDVKENYIATFSLLSNNKEITSQIGNNGTPEVRGFTSNKVVFEVSAKAKSIKLININNDGTDGAIIQTFTGVEELDTKKILIYVGADFNLPIDIIVRNIDPLFDEKKKVRFDKIVKQSVDQRTREKITILPVKRNIDKDVAIGDVDITSSVEVLTGEAIGDLYNIKVEVKYKNKTIYESSVAQNIEVVE